MTPRANIQKARDALGWLSVSARMAETPMTDQSYWNEEVARHKEIILTILDAALTPQIDVEALKREANNFCDNCGPRSRQSILAFIDHLASKGLISGVPPVLHGIAPFLVDLKTGKIEPIIPEGYALVPVEVLKQIRGTLEFYRGRESVGILKRNGVTRAADTLKAMLKAAKGV